MCVFVRVFVLEKALHLARFPPFFFFFNFSGISHQSLKNNLMPWWMPNYATPAGADQQTGFLLDILDAVCDVFFFNQIKKINFIQELICLNFSKRF